MHRIILPSAATLVFLAGCLDSPTLPQEPECATITSNVAEQRGDTVVTTTGLKYVDLQVGSGAAAVSCQWLLADFVGTLEDGTVFEDSKANGQPGEFLPGIQPLIDGFAEGLMGMRAGGRRLLIIPPQLGFGAEDRRDQQGNVVIPGNSTVIFDVELLEIAN